MPRYREGYHLCRPRLSLIISVREINRNIISRTFNDVRTIIVILANLPAVIRPIDFFLQPSIKPIGEVMLAAFEPCISAVTGRLR